MSPAIAFFAKGWKRLKFSFFTALSVLFLTRIFSVLLNTQANLGELVRPHLTSPDYLGWVSVGIFLLLFVAHHYSLRDLPEKLSLRLVKIFPICYAFLAIFTTKVANKSYLSWIFEGRVSFEDFLSLVSMDFFFQAPYTFWCLCWFPVTFYLARNFNKERFLGILWILPFFLLSLDMNNILGAFYFVLFLSTLIGLKFESQGSPRAIYTFWGLSFLTTILYLSYFSIIYKATIMVVTILFPLAWLIGYWYFRTCEMENSKPSMAISWFSLAIFGGLLSQALLPSPMGTCVFNFWFLIASLNFAFLTIIPTLFSLILSLMAGLISRKIEKPLFFMLIFCFASFYIADALVFFKNGMRLNYQTINWTLGLNSLGSIITTSIAVLGWQKILMLLLSFFTIGFSIFLASKKNYSKPTKAAFSSSLVILLVVSSVSFTASRFATHQLNVFRDPIRTLLATTPIFDLLDSRPELESLKKEFSQLGFDIDKSVQKFENAQSKLAEKSPKNLIMIVLESTGNEYISLFGQKDLTWPKLETLKDRMEIFPFYFSTFPESSNAEYSIMTGLMPVGFHILRTKPEFRSETMIEILKGAGYYCSIFFSGYLGDTGLSGFYLPRGLDKIYDAITLPNTSLDDGWIWGIKESVMVDNINKLLEERKEAPDKPFFIYYRSIFPHVPFDNIDGSSPHFSENDYLDGKWVGRFKNCLLYMDSQIFRLIKQLEKTGLDKDTYVMIVSDHATMLGEFGRTGHGWNLAPYLTNVPMLIIHPESKGLKTNLNSGSHIDILPTALNLIGAQDKYHNIIQGEDLRGEQVASRSIFLSSFNHKALIEGKNYYWYLEDNEQCQVYTFGLLGKKTKFRIAKDLAPYGVETRIEKIKKLGKLQKKLIMNFEFYNSRYKEQKKEAK